MILFFMTALIICGITASPAETELAWLLNHPQLIPSFAEKFIQNTYDALHETNEKYPYLAYGYDWLAFAHVVIAMAFIGPLRNPTKNVWVIEWAMLCCIAIFPLALIAGPIRDIPFYWTLIDCSFGILGIVPLYFCRKWILLLEKKPVVNQID